MKLSLVHLQFWLLRKSSLPGWGGPLSEKMVRPSIDMLVNRNAGLSPHVGLDTANTLAILRLARKSGKLRERLRAMAVRPGTVINPKRRAAHCKKWLARIEKEEACTKNVGT